MSNTFYKSCKEYLNLKFKDKTGEIFYSVRVTTYEEIIDTEIVWN